MSIYAVTQDIISYLQIVQTFAESPEYYPPETVLQGIYGTRYYAMLEKELAAEGDVEDLIDLTKKAFRKLIPLVQSFCPAQLTIGYDDSKYDPTIRFYHDEPTGSDMIGFLDLPCYIFYYSPNQEESKAKQKIKKYEKQINECLKKREALLDEYDYTKQTGAAKILMRMSRKENYEEVQQQVNQYDEKAMKLRLKLNKETQHLEEVQNDHQDRRNWIASLESSFAKYGVPSAEIVLTQGGGKNNAGE